MHAAFSLLDPARYIARLEARGKYWVATALDESLQPRGRSWGSGTDPNPRTPPTTHVDCPVCLGTICEDGAPTASCLF